VSTVNTTPEDLKPKLWKRYVDDILEVVKKGSVEKFTDFLNGLDDSNNIKFTYEVEQDGQLLFLDLLLIFPSCPESEELSTSFF